MLVCFLGRLRGRAGGGGSLRGGLVCVCVLGGGGVWGDLCVGPHHFYIEYKIQRNNHVAWHGEYGL